MTNREISVLTDVVAHSGEIADLSGIEGIKVDKHSTGGVGDKTTMVAGPIAAACGAKVAKMSGRGLGHTGGTIDKLEAIPGFRTTLTQQEFFDTVNQTGLSIIGQSGNLAPADKKMYALRDVTATVDSIPLIAASVMGKKLAAGSDSILLDVKTGSGAFMKTLEGSIELAKCMVAIGENAGKRTAALITDMDVPLGNCIGNSLEVMEAVETLKGNGPADLTEICVRLAGNMLYLADKGPADACEKAAWEAIRNGSALNCFLAMVKAQGGDASCILDTGKLPLASLTREVKAEKRRIYCAYGYGGLRHCICDAGSRTGDEGKPSGLRCGHCFEKETGRLGGGRRCTCSVICFKRRTFYSAERKAYRGNCDERRTTCEKPLIYAKVQKDRIEKY